MEETPLKMIRIEQPTYFGAKTVSYEENARPRRIKFELKSFKSFSNSVKRATLDVAKKLYEHAEQKQDEKISNVVSSANLYARYEGSEFVLKNAISLLQIQNVKLVFLDFAVKRFESISAPKEARTKRSVVERIRNSYSEFIKTVIKADDVAIDNRKMREDIFSAIKNGRVDDVRSIADRTYEPSIPAEEPVKVEPEKSSQSSGISDKDMEYLTNMFNGLADGSLDVKDLPPVPAVSEVKETEKVETTPVQEAETQSKPFGSPFDVPFAAPAPAPVQNVEQKPQTFETPFAAPLPVEANDYETKIGDLKIENSELNDANIGLRRQLDAANDEVNKQKRIISGFEMSFGRLDAKVREYQSDVSKLNSELEESRRAREEADKQAHAAREEAERLKAAFEIEKAQWEIERKQLKQSQESQNEALSRTRAAFEELFGSQYGGTSMHSSNESLGNSNSELANRTK